MFLAAWFIKIEPSNASSSSSVVINVPGYASKLQGTTGNSLYTNRNFYAFRSVFYGEKPTNLTRFLVTIPS